MARLRGDVIAFSVGALAVLGISIGLTVRHGAARSDVRRRFSGSRVVAELPTALASPRLQVPMRVVVIRDDAAADYYGRATTLDSIVAAWSTALRAAGAGGEVVSSRDLGRARNARVLVIPSSPCLTVATREAIGAAATRGQGIILTGLAGTQDAGCRPIGYGLITTLTGASRVEPLGDRPMSYVTIPDGGPLAADIPPGARIDVKPGAQVALRVADRDAFYSDYALEPTGVERQPLLDGAIAHAPNGRGRIVYWGFELRDVVGTPWGRGVVALLVRNSVAWSAGVAIASVEAWPAGHHAAAVIAQDVEADYSDARFALDSLNAARVPSTFYLVSDLAGHNKRLSKAMADAGEIGSHTENHRLLGGATLDEQRKRLHISQRDLTDLLGYPVRGLRPPEEQFDRATLVAWLRNGGTYVFGANDSRSGAPELLPLDGDTLILLGRVTPDDFGARADARAGVETAAAAYLNDFGKMRSLGGLYVLSYHSQLLARPDQVPVLARVARAIARDSTVWLATVGDVAQWWRARAGLIVSARVKGDQLVVDIRNRGPGMVTDAVVRVALAAPRRARTASVPLLASAPGIVRLALPPVGPGARRSVTVSLLAACGMGNILSCAGTSDSYR
jgi:peptidoglycan/xylan/chitin deacetylase (PgdA/CDA1 family)